MPLGQARGRLAAGPSLARAEGHRELAHEGVHPEIRHNLNVMCDFYHIDLDHHNAGSDSHACGELLLTMMDEGADIQQFIKTYYF